MSGGRTVVTDFEGNGLLHATGVPGTETYIGPVTKLWCCVAIDVDTEEVFQWRPDEMNEAMRFLSGDVETAIGHNWLDYDVRAAEKLYNGENGTYKFKRPPKIIDTLIYARIIRPADTLLGPDLQLRNRGLLPGNLLKSHGLKAWGIRISNLLGKDVNKKEYTGGWSAWSEEMQTYMVGDGWSNLALYHYLLRQIGWENANPTTYVWPKALFDTEIEVARVMLEQEEDGIRFDRDRASRLDSGLANAEHELESDIAEHFGNWWKPLDDIETGRTSAKDMEIKRPDWGVLVTIPRTSKLGKPLKPYIGPPIEHHTAGAPYVRLERVTFNPGSRDNLGERLIKDYGWKPSRFGKNLKPTVDEAVLKEIPESVMPTQLRDDIRDYFTVSKIRGMLSKGKRSWMALSEEDGRLHPHMDTAGAVTGRATHRNPNITTLPAVIVAGEPERPVMGLAGGFGYECRDLVTAEATGLTEMTGVDMSALELILVGHYAYPFDGGELAERVSDPDRDPHGEHAVLTDLPRRDTKTVTYLWIFGGGAGRAGEEVTLTPEEIVELQSYPSLPMLLRNKAEREGTAFVMPDEVGRARLSKGHIVVKRFEAKMPALKQVKKAVMEAAGKGWLKGIDGRKLYVRKTYAAVATLIQGGGAEACKLWIRLTHRNLRGMGMVWGADYASRIWAHDEQQFVNRPGLGDQIGRACLEAAHETSEILKLHGQFRTAYKIGHTWAETH